MATPVVFKMGTKAQFDALESKNPYALYFLTDTHELYHGANGMAQSAFRSDIKTVEADDLEVIANFYSKSEQNGIYPVKGDIFAVKTLVADEKYAQSVYMFDGVEWQNISATVSYIGDEKSIEVGEDNVIALKDFGKRFYKFVPQTGTEEEGNIVSSHYELVEVNDENPWSEGLEPRIVLEDNEYVIGWYQPNLDTTEGVQNQVAGLQNSITDIQSTVSNVQGEVDKVEEDVLELNETVDGLTEEVNDIHDALYGTEGESPVPGLIEQVATLEKAVEDQAKDLDNNYYTKEETYSREEIDGKVSGVFHFKGTAESFEALPAEKAEGDVYQVGEKEYAWNGEEWVELGFVVDLSQHALKSELEAVAGDLDVAEEAIADHAERLEAVEGTLYTEETGLVTVVGDLNDRLVGVEEVLTDETSGIGALDTRVENLEGILNAETTGLVAVAADLIERVTGLEAVGAEKNVIVGVSVNDVALVPNEDRIVNIPVFAGADAGLVPVASELETPEVHFLNAQGDWVDLGAMMDEKIEAVMTWGSIEE